MINFDLANKLQQANKSKYSEVNNECKHRRYKTNKQKKRNVIKSTTEIHL